MPKTATPLRPPTVTDLIETHTVIGTHHQLATVIGHAEASGRLVSAGPIRPVCGDRSRVICTIRLRPPQRRQLAGATPRYRRTWRALTSPRGRRTLRITAICIAIAALVAALAWLVIAVVVPTVAWVIAHGLYILGGLAALVIAGGLIAATIDRCPTCGR